MKQMEAWAAIIAEIERRLSAGESGAAVSAAMGKERTYVNRVMADKITGKRINMDEMRAMMRGLGLKMDKDPEPQMLEGFVLVRRVKALLGAGSSLVTDDTPDGMYAFREDFIRSLGMRAKPVLFGVIGDSMEPTLKNGDTVLIDTADQLVRAGQLYAVNIGEELHIKRVFIKPDETVVLKSDNSDYPSWDVPKSERPRIIGRARWVGRVL